jgi:hypothetical protein
MDNNISNNSKNFIKGEILKLERNSFAIGIIINVVAYSLITLWLNSIRTTAALWFVWVLIIIQIILYVLIFVKSYNRSRVFGLKAAPGVTLFTILFWLGRVNDWELLIIPLLVVIMLILSARNKNISMQRQYLLSDNN